MGFQKNFPGAVHLLVIVPAGNGQRVPPQHRQPFRRLGKTGQHSGPRMTDPGAIWTAGCFCRASRGRRSGRADEGALSPSDCGPSQMGDPTGELGLEKMVQGKFPRRLALCRNLLRLQGNRRHKLA